MVSQLQNKDFSDGFNMLDENKKKIVELLKLMLFIVEKVKIMKF